MSPTSTQSIWRALPGVPRRRSAPHNRLHLLTLSPDYYSYLAIQAGDLFRLNCEELTGQTNKSDARRRQRLFQDIMPARAAGEPSGRSRGSTQRNNDDGGGCRYRTAYGRDDGEHATDALQLPAASRTSRTAWCSGLSSGAYLCAVVAVTMTTTFSDHRESHPIHRRSHTWIFGATAS